MKKTYDPIKALKVPLTPYEQSIEDAFEEREMVPDPSMNEKLREAARETLRGLRGGARAGAGRKPRAHVRTTVLLAPGIRAKLERLAKKQGSLSAAVEHLVEQA